VTEGYQGIVLQGGVQYRQGPRCHLRLTLRLAVADSGGRPLPVRGNPASTTVEGDLPVDGIQRLSGSWVIGGAMMWRFMWREWCNRGLAQASVRVTADGASLTVPGMDSAPDEPPPRGPRAGALPGPGPALGGRRLAVSRRPGRVLGLVAPHDHGEERRLLLPPTRLLHPQHRSGDAALGVADLGVVGEVAGEADGCLGHGAAPFGCLSGRSALPFPGDGGCRGMPRDRQGQAMEPAKSASASLGTNLVPTVVLDDTP
jgi:hypothetical protein